VFKASSSMSNETPKMRTIVSDSIPTNDELRQTTISSVRNRQFLPMQILMRTCISHPFYY